MKINEQVIERATVKRQRKTVAEIDEENFAELEERARIEGRLDSNHVCRVCGIGYLDREGADECCRAAGLPVPDHVPYCRRQGTRKDWE